MNARTYTQILSRISPFYHDDFRRIVMPIIDPGESIIWAGNWFTPNVTESQYTEFEMGFMLISSSRWVIITYSHIDPKRNRQLHVLRLQDGIHIPDLPTVKLIIPDPPYISEIWAQNIMKIYRADFQVRTVQGIRIFPTFKLDMMERQIHLAFYDIEDGNAVLEILRHRKSSLPRHSTGVLDLSSPIPQRSR